MTRPPPERATPSRSTRIGHLAALILLPVLVFSGSFDGQFVSDDIPTVRDNARIRSLDWAHTETIFRTFDGPNYAPLKVYSLAIDYRLWGPWPAGFHLTNLLLHIGCALLVYAILLRLGLPATAACCAAALWAVHPLQVESVAWISERKSVLSGLFFLAAFYAYLAYSEHGGAGAYVVVLVLYVCALLSRMNTMVLPALCLAYEVAYRFRLRRRDVLASVPLFALAALVGWYNLAGNPIHGVSFHGGSRTVTWLSSAVVVFRYLRRLILPFGLVPQYAVPLYGSLLAPPVLLAVSALLALAGATLWSVSRRRPAGFWILWFGITLAPMLNIVVPFASLMQDRYMYLPMIGPLALAASALAGLRSRALRRAAGGVAAAAIIAAAVLGIRQVEVWTSPMTLWQATVLQGTFGMGDRAPADFGPKIAFLRKALKRYPSSAVVHHNLGALYFETGHLADALPLLETAVQLEPENGMALLNLARAYVRARRLPEAEEMLRRAAAAEPYFLSVYLELARLYLARGDAPRARQALETCARLHPEPVAARAWERESAQLARLEAGEGAAER